MNRIARGAVASITAMLFRLIPRRARYSAILFIGTLLTPIVGPLLLRRFPDIWGGRRDETLRVIFLGLMRRQVRFDPRVDAHVPDEVLEVLSRGGALFLSVHFPLNALFTRWLYDRGHRVTLVRRTPLPAWVWGTDVDVPMLRPTNSVMLQIRTRLAEGAPVFLAIDRARPESHPYPVETRYGKTDIATPIFALAKRINVPTFFFSVRATKGLPVIEVERISPEPEAFAELFRRHTAEMLP